MIAKLVIPHVYLLERDRDLGERSFQEVENA